METKHVEYNSVTLSTVAGGGSVSSINWWAWGWETDRPDWGWNLPTAGPGPVNQDTSEVAGLSLKYFSGVNLLGGGGGSGGVCLLF